MVRFQAPERENNEGAIPDTGVDDGFGGVERGCEMQDIDRVAALDVLLVDAGSECEGRVLSNQSTYDMLRRMTQ